MFFKNFSQFGDKLFAIEDSGKEMTYRQLEALAGEFGKCLKKRSLVFVFCENSISCASGYLSFLNNGVVPLLIDKKIDDALADNLISIYKPDYLYVPDELEGRRNSGKTVFTNDGYSLVETGNERNYPLYEELGLLLTTSGSVGSPKLVRQSYTNISSNAKAIATFLKLTPEERPITTLPMNYTYGLSIVNSHVHAGAAICFTQNTVVSKAFWDFFKQCGVTSFGGVPFTYEMLKKIRFFKMELPTLKTMTQSGAKLTSEQHMEFATWAKDNGKDFVLMYGQTEATARMCYMPPELATQKCGSIGVAIPGGKLYLLDTDGSVIEEADKPGELVYEGENVTLGYAECEQDLAKGDERFGKLKTGDIATRDKDGFYYIVGRIKRFLKLYGNRVNMDEIDRLVRAKFGIDCATVGTDSLCITYITDESLTEEVERFLAKKTHLNSKAFKAIYMPVIPKNNSGKVLFSQLKNTVD